MHDREAILDAASISDEPLAVLDVVLRVVQRRLTTPARLSDALARRKRQRWRRLIADVIAESAIGVASPLERQYLHRVERPHGLPRPERNRPEPRDHGTSRFWDVDYARWNTLVELDGLAYHPEDERCQDRRKDNAGTLSGRCVLHYGWRDVELSPGQVAGEVGQMLQSQGWPGVVRSYGSDCRARRAA